MAFTSAQFEKLDNDSIALLNLFIPNDFEKFPLPT